ncbi:MAG: putative porin [Limisphaerales bacterium]
METLIEKGILTVDEAKKIEAETAARETNAVNNPPISKWKISDSIKSLQLFGDLRLRYEYRGTDNAPTVPPGTAPSTYYRERFRYALRIGLRGDLVDDFNYGLRLETSSNPRSPWSTFGNNTTSGSVTPADKSQSSIYIGQAYLGWHPADWYEMTVGRMPMPLYTTPMVWDSDINPEGAFEKFKYTVDNVDLFVDFGQWDYQDPSEATAVPSSDTFMLTWQAGANVRIGKDMSVKVAPMLYTYTGTGSTNGGNANGLNIPYTGQGSDGVNVNYPGGPAFNQNGINDLLILEIPAEYDFKIRKTPFGVLQGRIFGDFAYNLDGADRARAAYQAGSLGGAFPPDVKSAETSQVKAYQVGIGFGSAGPVYGPVQGLVYGSTSQKNTWEARFYWQHIEQYALDVNLIDSDFFEGRANLQGFYSAFAYSFTDNIIGTIRAGYANQIQDNLGTGGNNLDIPGINPIKNFHILQLDLTWRF